MTNPLYRSILFTPGTRVDRFEKAFNSGADAICLDLEDSVLPCEKVKARNQVIQYLQAPASKSCTRYIRINSLETPEGRDDLTEIVDNLQGKIFLIVPKVNAIDPLDMIAERLRAKGAFCNIIPLIEDPRGIRNALKIIEHPLVVSVALGVVDLAAILGAELSWESLLMVRSSIILAAAEAGKSAIDGPFVGVKSPDALEQEANASKKLGFSGKLAIHPNQVAIINRAFTPSKEQLKKDRKIIELASSEGVVIIDGKMVDKPIIESARDRLKLAEQLTSMQGNIE